jgi:hypothetical protein
MQMQAQMPLTRSADAQTVGVRRAPTSAWKVGRRERVGFAKAPVERHSWSRSDIHGSYRSAELNYY